MKNKILIHKNYNHSKIFLKMLFVLIPLILYGVYKNGILPFIDNNINFFEVLKPLLLPLIGLLSGLLVNFITQKKLEFNSLMLYGLMVGMILPISTNTALFAALIIILLYGFNFLEKKFEVNPVCLIKLLIIGLLLILNSYEYANINEINSTYAISIIDILFGRGIGGVASTSILLILIGFLLLLTDYYYKKEIPLIAIFSYVSVTFGAYFIIKDFNVILANLFNAAPLFAFVFIAPLSKYSSYTLTGKVLFGILVGLITALLVFFIGPMEAPIIAILVVSIFANLLDKLDRQKTLK